MNSNQSDGRLPDFASRSEEYAVQHSTGKLSWFAPPHTVLQAQRDIQNLGVLGILIILLLVWYAFEEPLLLVPSNVLIALPALIGSFAAAFYKKPWGAVLVGLYLGLGILALVPMLAIAALLTVIFAEVSTFVALLLLPLLLIFYFVYRGWRGAYYLPTLLAAVESKPLVSTADSSLVNFSPVNSKEHDLSLDQQEVKTN